MNKSTGKLGWKIKDLKERVKYLENEIKTKNNIILAQTCKYNALLEANRTYRSVLESIRRVLLVSEEENKNLSWWLKTK